MRDLTPVPGPRRVPDPASRKQKVENRISSGRDLRASRPFAEAGAGSRSLATRDELTGQGGRELQMGEIQRVQQQHG